MRRREFITLLCGAATWPLAARAQQVKMPVIGFLNSQTHAKFVRLLAGFHQGLNEAGFIERQNVAIEYRWAEGRTEQLRKLAEDLVRRKVVLIVATGGSLVAAKAATKAAPIPLVATFGGDPVVLGLVDSLNRPGGNITGVSVLTSDLEGKRLEMLHEVIPKRTLIGVFVDPKFPYAASQLREVQAAAGMIGRQTRIIRLSNASDIDTAFAALAEMGIGAVAAVGGPFFTSRRAQLVELAARHKVPAIFDHREFTKAGALMSYGPNMSAVFRQLGGYAGRILKGQKPSGLPVVQPAKFELIINLKTAKALGLTVPPILLARADEVIE